MNKKLAFSTLVWRIMYQPIHYRTFVIKNAVDWDQKNLKKYFGACPTIDFNKSMIVCAFYGACSSGGFSVEITNITETDTEITVTYKLHRPPRNSMNTMAITYPCHMVVCDKSDKPVVFKEV
jgi:hypothetical protein